MSRTTRRTLATSATLLLLVLTLLIASLTWAMDQDGDTDTDVDDINIILAALNTAATVGDPRDLNSDGLITILDARLAVLDCTRPLCVTGNNPPTITGPMDQTIPEDGTTGPLAVTVGDPDIGADPNALVLTATSSDQALIPDSNLTVGGTGTARTITATPVADGSGGPVMITLVVDDGAATDNTATAMFNVTVNPVNDAPTIDAIADPAMIPEDAPQQTINMTGISTGAANETQTITVTATSDNTALIPNPTVNYTSPNATGSLQYTPAPGQSGVAVVTVTVMDDGGTVNGGVDTTVETFTVNVNAVNDPPTITGPADQTILEDASTGALAVTVDDPDGDPNAIVVTATSSDQALIPDGNIVVGGTGTMRTVTVTPAADANGGPATITLTADDGGAANNTAMTTFDVTVTAVNDAPTIDAITDPAAIPEDSPQQTVNMSGISAGPSNETQTISITATSGNTGLIPNPTVNYTSPNATGSLQYTPVAGQSGSAVITVTVTDSGGTANGGVDTTVETFTVNVSSVNTAPVLDPIGDQAVDEGNLLTFTAAATDPDMPPDTVSFSLDAGAPAGASITTGGVFTWTPTEAQGPDSVSITVRATDDGSPPLSDSETITVTVNEVNVAPVLGTIGNQTATQLSNLSFTATATDTDVPANTLTFTLDAGAPSGASINSGSGVFSWTPNGAQNGDFDITVRVTDDGSPALNDFETITVSVSSGVSFANDVYPVLSAGTGTCQSCHTASATTCGTFGGQNLTGTVAEVYAELVTEASCSTTASGNRTDTTTPTDSLILLKPTGSVSHGGGTRAGWTVDNCAMTPTSNYCLTLRWIQDGVPNN